MRSGDGDSSGEFHGVFQKYDMNSLREWTSPLPVPVRRKRNVKYLLASLGRFLVVSGHALLLLGVLRGEPLSPTQQALALIMGATWMGSYALEDLAKWYDRET